eukprot:7804514-Pyramimonas_sp.AAC.1
MRFPRQSSTLISATWILQCAPRRYGRTFWLHEGAGGHSPRNIRDMIDDINAEKEKDVALITREKVIQAL